MRPLARSASPKRGPLPAAYKLANECDIRLFRMQTDFDSSFPEENSQAAQVSLLWEAAVSGCAQTAHRLQEKTLTGLVREADALSGIDKAPALLGRQHPVHLEVQRAVCLITAGISCSVADYRQDCIAAHADARHVMHAAAVYGSPGRCQSPAEPQRGGCVSARRAAAAGVTAAAGLSAAAAPAGSCPCSREPPMMLYGAGRCKLPSGCLRRPACQIWSTRTQ